MSAIYIQCQKLKKLVLHVVYEITVNYRHLEDETKRKHIVFQKENQY
jgi:hypothetical protein